MLNKILTALLAISFVFIGVLYKSNHINKNTAIRLEDNYNSSIKENKVLHLKMNELSNELYGRIDSLSYKLKIKPKQITRYVHIRTIDTVRIVDTVFSKAIKIDSILYAFNKDTACFHISGLIKSSPISIAFTELEHKNNIEYLLFLERNEWEWWFIRSRLFGRKIVKLETFSDCGISTVEEIEIIKK